MTLAILLALSILTTANALHAQETENAVPDSVTSERVLAGSAIYNGGSCVFCHMVGGRGVGARAPDLSDIEWLHSEGDFDGIRRTIFWGVPRDRFKAVSPRPFPMNPKGGLTLDQEQMNAITAYVWSVSRPETNHFVQMQRDFIDLASRGDLDEARPIFDRSEGMHGQELLPQPALNALGYAIMGGGDIDAAIDVFQLNVDLHPDAFNPWDSLAEAYMSKGDNAKAIEYYRKSLELNPGNQNARDKLSELGASP